MSWAECFCAMLMSTVFELILILPCLAALLGAVHLAFAGISGWGWVFACGVLLFVFRRRGVANGGK